MHNTKPAIQADTPITEGAASAPRIQGRVPLRWTLDPTNGHVTANGEHAGRVVESIPGKLYYFQDPHDAAKGDYWGMFETPARAAERGAVRAVLTAHAIRPQVNR